jgi:hypothetical protein
MTVALNCLLLQLESDQLSGKDSDKVEKKSVIKYGVK